MNVAVLVAGIALVARASANTEVLPYYETPEESGEMQAFRRYPVMRKLAAIATVAILFSGVAFA